MLKKNNIKYLPQNYNYYTEVLKKTQKIAKDILKDKYNVVLEQKLYQLVLNLLNQAIYDIKYEFSREDIYLITEFDIDICKVLDYYNYDFLRQKESVYKNNKSRIKR